MEKLAPRDKVIDKSSFNTLDHKKATVISVNDKFLKGKTMLELLYEGEVVVKCIYQNKNIQKLSPNPVKTGIKHRVLQD